ncbi:MAG: YraN family protein [Ruminococcaceae bacterium]|nr:YraN family protein [Oscillospiraceae bacterium]
MTGEDVAAKFLEQNGYTVIERNYRSGHREIDIIARDEQFLVFVEVKTRSCLIPERMAYGRPASAVSATKQKNIVAAARAYLRAHPDNILQPRLDVIEVYLKKTVAGAPPQLLDIHHIRNAFMAR